MHGNRGFVRPLADDTHPDAERVLIAILRSWTPRQRLQRACELSAAARRRALECYRFLHPEETEEEIRLRFIRNVYGEATADRIVQRLRTTGA